VSETRADWIEVLADTPAPDSRHIFSPAVGNLVCCGGRCASFGDRQLESNRVERAARCECRPFLRVLPNLFP
jgi:hypothetical protein